MWTAPSWQGKSSRRIAGRCSHVFGLFARRTGPLAIMPSADQVPVKSPHSIMHWHFWVVLIAGSTGSALRAVRPPNLHIAPDGGAISFTLLMRRVPCSVHPWPSWPTPSSRSCWRARLRNCGPRIGGTFRAALVRPLRPHFGRSGEFAQREGANLEGWRPLRDAEARRSARQPMSDAGVPFTPSSLIFG